MVNRQKREVPDGCTVRELVVSLGYEPTKVSVWIGGRQIWQREYDTLRPTEGVEVRIIRPIAGG
ncbi:MAG TPA: MoaD/ThiS family protein [Bacillota bacterium]